MSYFKYKGKNIYYESYGQGKPIVILNGIMMSTPSWTPFINAFSKDNQLILLDFLDQGRSDKMDVPYTQDIQVEVLKAALDELGIDKINILGISYGGEVAILFTEKYQERVDRLVLFNTTAKTSNWLRDIGAGWNRSADDALDYYCTAIPVIYSPKFYDEKSEWMENRKKLLTENVFNQKPFMDSMVRLTESSDYLDATGELSKITVPTIIVCCENDQITSMPEQRYLNQMIKNSELVMLPNTGHASMYERPVLFASIALGFINIIQTDFNII
jgi:pimeloyl-ACP methyl ester carboxylesterase